MKRALASLGLVAAIAVGVVGCGSDSESSTDSGAGSIDTTSAPDQVRWESWQGVAVPVSSVDGPRTIDGAVAAGYTQTPQGAVLAAAQGVTRLRLAPDNAWPQVANAVAAPSKGRDLYAVSRVQVSITGPVPAGSVDALRGFRVDEFSADRAVVELVTEQSGRGLTASTHTLVWSGDDWKVLLPDPDGDSPQSEQVTSLADYTQFEAKQ